MEGLDPLVITVYKQGGFTLQGNLNGDITRDSAFTCTAFKIDKSDYFRFSKEL
jgi:hypothetical protein